MRETKFKQTETGPIPEDWEVKRLGELLSVGSGRSYKHLSVGDVPVYGTGGLMCFVDDYLYDGETVCIGRKGTINVPYYHEGKIWTVDTLFFTHSFNGLIPKYAYYLFLTIDWLCKNEASGVPSLSRSNIEQTKVAVPPLEVQKRIASALSSVDELIASLDKQIAKTRDIKQGVVQQLLSNENTPYRILGETCDITTGKLNVNAKDDAGKYPFFTCDLEPYRINTYAFDTTAILIAGNGYVGHVNYYSGKFNAYQRTYVLSNFKGWIYDKYLLHYVKAHLRPYLTKDTRKASVPFITLPTLRGFPVPVSPIEEQKHIADVLTSFDDTIEGLEAKRQKYESIKAGMMQQLLTGATCSVNS